MPFVELKHSRRHPQFIRSTGIELFHQLLSITNHNRVRAKPQRYQLRNLAVDAVNHESDTLDREILNLKTELEIRRELANNSPMTIIQRHGTRASGSRGIYEGDPVPDRLNQLQRSHPGGTP